MKLTKLITTTAFLVAAPASFASAETVSRTVNAGKTTQIFTFYVFNKGKCSASPFARTKLRGSNNGKLTFKNIRFKIRAGKACAGKTVNAVSVSYTPNSGFRGRDKARFGFNFAQFVDGEGYQYYGVTANINVK